MMNRRQFIYASAAGAALLGRVPGARAATYDLILKGGRVIDPSAGLDAVRDVAIAQGKIAAIQANIPGDASETIDVRGKIVVPGADRHPHDAGRSKEGPPNWLQDGVTGWIDAGTVGADNIARTLRSCGRAATGPSWSNIARTGVITPGGELLDSRATSPWRRAPSRAIATSSLAEGAPVEQCRRHQRSRGAKARAGSGRTVQSAGDDPCRPELFADAPIPLAQARRHRHPHVRAGARTASSTIMACFPRRAGGAPPRHLFDFGNGVADHFDWDTVERR